MKHNVNISVSKTPGSDSILQCRNVTIREKLLTRLLGKRERVMIVIPGNCVDTLSITEITKGVCQNENG